jgi:TonB family protein
MEMSAAPSMQLETASRRGIPRRPLFVPLDVIVLRSGIPENLPGRCTDLSEGGVGAIVAGELIPGQQVAIELRLPNMGVPVRSRALVRYQQRLQCGLQFVGLTPEQRQMIRYWASRVPARSVVQPKEEPPAIEAPVSGIERKVRKIRVRLRRFYLILALTVILAGLGWWQWERSWKELEGTSAATPEPGAPLKVSPEIMSRHISFKTDPVYPEAARQAGLEGVVALDVVIGSDGTVKRLTPMSGPDLLVQAAMMAVESWKFESYLLDGTPRDVETTVTVEFRLK